MVTLPPFPQGNHLHHFASKNFNLLELKAYAYDNSGKDYYHGTGSDKTVCMFVVQKRLSEGMGLWTLLEGFLLLANALAILNEDRFLAPRGWSFSDVSGVQRGKSLKGQLIGLIYATQYLRVPLIVLNAITILVKLVSG